MTSQEKTQRIQLIFNFSPELYQTLNKLSQQIQAENAEVLIKAIALLEIATEAKQKGKHLQIVDENQNLEADSIDLANIIAHQVEKPLVISKINLDSQPDTELERKLREIKFKQELRKDWILFIARDIVIFSTLILFFLIITGYSLLTLLRAC